VNNFMFATGIENSYPVVQLPDGSRRRIDEMEKTGHYRFWRDDFRLVKELGIDVLRYGVPLYRTHLAPGRYDWSFAHDALGEIRQLGLTPVIDLCHFGVPDWLGNFQNPEFPRFFSEYAKAFALQFPWIKLYNPINEMYVAARFSARLGIWNERLCSERAFVTATKHLARANILAAEAILSVTPRARFIQSESSEYFHPADPDAEIVARHLNQLRFLPLDLNYGVDVSASMLIYLMENGMTLKEYNFFRDRNIKSVSVMGNDYYATNEHTVYADGRTEQCEIFGYYVITKQYYDRYRLPVMHTETNNRNGKNTDYDAPVWLRRQWSNLIRLKEDGVPIIGFTWYSLVDQMDWDTLLTEENGTINHYGLFDLERRIRPAGDAYRDLIKTWRGRVDSGLISLD
jgi:beta-glucosidase/6-phospho-beta-glucosidase/beta-galactosidase